MGIGHSSAGVGDGVEVGVGVGVDVGEVVGVEVEVDEGADDGVSVGMDKELDVGVGDEDGIIVDDGDADADGDGLGTVTIFFTTIISKHSESFVFSHVTRVSRLSFTAGRMSSTDRSKLEKSIWLLICVSAVAIQPLNLASVVF